MVALVPAQARHPCGVSMTFLCALIALPMIYVVGPYLRRAINAALDWVLYAGGDE